MPVPEGPARGGQPASPGTPHRPYRTEQRASTQRRWSPLISSRHQGVPTPTDLQFMVVRLTDTTLDEIRQAGFALVEGFLAPDELKAAQEALWLHFPNPEDYFADPARYADLARS